MQDKLDPSRLAALGGCPAGIHGQSEASARHVAAHDQAPAMMTCPELALSPRPPSATVAVMKYSRMARIP